MTSNQFHIAKEKQAIIIMQTLQSVKINKLSQELKDKMISLSEEAIQLIDDQRKQVYKQLKDFDYKVLPFEHDSPDASIFGIKLKDEDSFTSLQNKLTKDLSDIESVIEKEYVEGIVDQDNYKSFVKSPTYKAQTSRMISIISEMKEAIAAHDVNLNKKPEVKKEEVTETENEDGFIAKINPFKKKKNG